MKLRLGTRGSDLARAQSTWVAERLAAEGCEVELSIISTAGDQSAAPSFGAIGPQGVFVREIENALLAGEVDVAVHSFKDLPTQSPGGLTVAAVPGREDPSDVLLTRTAAVDTSADGLLPLAANARVGTASARRQVWLRHFRPDLVVDSLRGNVPTRIRRLRAGDFDAILLAGAGIRRLQEGTDVLAELLDGLELVPLDPKRFVAAPAQGALAVQCRAEDTATRDLVARLDDARAHAAVNVEREALALAEGGCDAAFGAYCDWSPDAGFALAIMAERAGSIEQAFVRGPSSEGLGALGWSVLERAARSHA